MKILQVNSVYKKGSTGKMVYDIHTSLLAKNIESIVVYGRGDKVKDNYVYKSGSEYLSHFSHLLSKFTGVMYGNNYLSTWVLIYYIKKYKPDIVHLQCINGYFVNIYILLKWLKKNRIKTVLTLHAEFMYTGGCGHSYECNKWKEYKKPCGNCPYFKTEIKTIFDCTRKMWKKMYNAFQNFHDDLIITSVSPWLMNRAKTSPMLKEFKHITITNGIETSDIFRYRDTANLKKELGIGDKNVLLYVTPYFNIEEGHIKGGKFIIELAKILYNRNIVIIVIGKFDDKINYPSNIVLKGQISNQFELANYYSLADLTLLTSKRETFSMVTAESLSCGTPVIGFISGGPETIALPKYSSFVPYGDMTKFTEQIDFFLNTVWDKQKISLESKVYSKELMTDQYIQVYKELL